MITNYYEILQVDKNASLEEIRSAYRKMALKHHPDKSQDPNSQTIFLQVVEAWEILRDEKKRKLHDKLLLNPQNAEAESDDFKIYREYQSDAEVIARDLLKKSYDVFVACLGGLALVSGYVLIGDTHKISFGDKLLTGFFGVLIIILIIIAFTVVGAPIALPLIICISKSLQIDGHFIGVGNLIINTILFVITAIIAILILCFGCATIVSIFN